LHWAQLEEKKISAFRSKQTDDGRQRRRSIRRASAVMEETNSAAPTSTTTTTTTTMGAWVGQAATGTQQGSRCAGGEAVVDARDMRRRLDLGHVHARHTPEGTRADKSAVVPRISALEHASSS
jgi:hypothetical protein